MNCEDALNLWWGWSGDEFNEKKKYIWEDLLGAVDDITALISKVQKNAQ